MYAKSIRPSAKCEVQKEWSVKRDDQIFRSAKRVARMCPQSGQILLHVFLCPIIHSDILITSETVILFLPNFSNLSVEIKST